MNYRRLNDCEISGLASRVYGSLVRVEAHLVTVFQVLNFARRLKSLDGGVVFCANPDSLPLPLNEQRDLFTLCGWEKYEFNPDIEGYCGTCAFLVTRLNCECWWSTIADLQKQAEGCRHLFFNCVILIFFSCSAVEVLSECLPCCYTTARGHSHFLLRTEQLCKERSTYSPQINIYFFSLLTGHAFIPSLKNYNK